MESTTLVGNMLLRRRLWCTFVYRQLSTGPKHLSSNERCMDNARRQLAKNVLKTWRKDDLLVINNLANQKLAWEFLKQDVDKIVYTEGAEVSKRRFSEPNAIVKARQYDVLSSEAWSSASDTDESIVKDLKHCTGVCILTAFFGSRKRNPSAIANFVQHATDLREHPDFSKLRINWYILMPYKVYEYYARPSYIKKKMFHAFHHFTLCRKFDVGNIMGNLNTRNNKAKLFESQMSAIEYVKDTDKKRRHKKRKTYKIKNLLGYRPDDNPRKMALVHISTRDDTDLPIHEVQEFRCFIYQLKMYELLLPQLELLVPECTTAVLDVLGHDKYMAEIHPYTLLKIFLAIKQLPEYQDSVLASFIKDLSYHPMKLKAAADAFISKIRT